MRATGSGLVVIGCRLNGHVELERLVEHGIQGSLFYPGFLLGYTSALVQEVDLHVGVCDCNESTQRNGRGGGASEYGVWVVFTE